MRRLAVLIEHLPRDSAYVRAQLGWQGAVEDTLSDIAHYLRVAIWQRGGDPKQPQPSPYPHPLDKVRQAAIQAAVDETAARLQRLEEMAKGGV
jgi:hypothetical protein